MTNQLKKTTAPFLILIILFLTSSCALKPLKSEYTFVRDNMENVNLDKLGNGKIMIYNGADILHKVDVTGRLNVWIDDQALGQIRPAEYVVIELKQGNHEFKLLHIDMVNMRSTHPITITDTTTVIRIKPTITSNKLSVTNKLPKKFDKFKYGANR